MKLNLRNLLNDRFVRGTFILTAVSFLSAALNYLIHPLLTRRLTIAEYGDYQALLSFLAVLGIIGTVVNTAFTKKFSVLSADSPEEIKSLRRHAANRLFLLGIILFALVIAFSGFFNRLFKIGQPTTVIITALSLILVFPLMVNRALLTGRQYFSALSFNNFLDAFSRLALAFVLVVFWPLGLIGASFALGLSSLLPFIISFWQIKKVGLPEVVKDFSGSFKKIWRYGFLVLWFTILAQFFYNFDMLFVKSSFSPEEAGLYSALLTIGRIVFFIGSAIPLVMFPVIAGLKKDLSPRKYFVLIKSLGLMSLLAVPTAIFISIFPQFTIKLVVGVKYLALVPYLPVFAWVIFALTLLTVISQYFLALSRRFGLVVLALGAVAEVILVSFFHADLWQVIWSLALVFGGLDLTLLGLCLFDYLADRKNIVKETDKRTKEKINWKIFWAELASRIREFYPYFLGFYTLALLVSLCSKTWKLFFYWPGLHYSLIFFTILFIFALKFDPSFNFRLEFAYIIQKFKTFLFLLKNRISTLPRRVKIKIVIEALVIIVFLVFALLKNIGAMESFILIYALISISFFTSSRFSVILVLAGLVICPMLLLLKEIESAEKIAVYIFYLLIIIALTQIRGLWRENKQKIAANIEENNN